MKSRDLVMDFDTNIATEKLIKLFGVEELNYIFASRGLEDLTPEVYFELVKEFYL